MSKKKIELPVGKLFGLAKDPVRKAGILCYFLVSATVDEDGEIIKVDRSAQSWFLWEALHKQERASEEWLRQLHSSEIKELKI